MPEWGLLLFWPAYLYLTASAAAALALAARPGRRGPMTLSDARLRVLLPPAAVLLLPLWTAVFPHSGLAHGPAHQWWHQWEDAVHGSAILHGLLHFGNLALLALAGVSLARVVGAIARERAFAGAVAVHAERAGDRPDLPLYRLRLAQPFCFTLGWLRPRIYLSTGLEAQLEPDELSAMLAHEQQHTNRRDGLFGGVLRVFYTLLPIPGGGVLLRDWRGATERACDAGAAQTVGSHVAVAKALLNVASSVVRPTPPPGAARFTGDEDVEGRVNALLNPPTRPKRTFSAWAWVAGCLLLVVAPALHHLTELLVHH